MNSPKLLRSVLIIIAVAIAVSGLLDDASQSVAEESLKRALVTFAAARTLNGVISAAQGTEVALEPGGVGVVLSVGEALDPINDLVERFSSVMLVAASSLGLQNILLGISRWWGVNAVLALLGAVAIVVFWFRASSGPDHGGVAFRLFLIVLFVRFAVPLLVLGTNTISEAFLAEELDQSTAALEATRADIEEINETVPPAAEADQTLLDRLGSMLDESLQSINAPERLERLRDTASNAAEHIVNLIVIFVLQTILLPLGIFWLLLEIVKGFVSRLAQRPG